jgi:hypothetical protein
VCIPRLGVPNRLDRLDGEWTVVPYSLGDLNRAGHEILLRMQGDGGRTQIPQFVPVWCEHTNLGEIISDCCVPGHDLDVALNCEHAAASDW